jgi:oligopeptide/dipeptide ABC transporter ATP-binding protein
MPPLLDIAGLRLRYPGSAGPATVLHGIDLHLPAGASLGIVGESGSGKSQVLYAIAGLLGPGAQLEGLLCWKGEPLNAWSPARRRALLGASIGFVFQDPLAALNPYLRLDLQLTEALCLHHGLDQAAALAQARRLLDAVQLPIRVLGQYPHELSGGMRQRLMLALALSCGPELLLADEPTTALDASLRLQMLALMAALRRDFGFALIFVSHDLAAVAALCEQAQVLYAGRTLEQGPTGDLLRTPHHPYTQALLAARPGMSAPVDAPLPSIPGSPPRAGAALSGCVFADRCAHADNACRQSTPALRSMHPAGTRSFACHHPRYPAAGAV